VGFFAATGITLENLKKEKGRRQDPTRFGILQANGKREAKTTFSKIKRGTKAKRRVKKKGLAPDDESRERGNRGCFGPKILGR